jgi:glycine/sarcosine N-methyltransferase
MVLDVACGIGTQASALALQGFSVVGSDVSIRSLRRGHRESQGRGVHVPAIAADLRALPFRTGCADVVIACDNAVPHLLSLRDIRRAMPELKRCARPGGGVIISMRDYKRMPAGTQEVRPYGEREWKGHRYFAEQQWKWNGPTDNVTMRFRALARGLDTIEFSTTYFAVAIEQVREIMWDTCLSDVERIDDVFYQPLLMHAFPPRHDEASNLSPRFARRSVGARALPAGGSHGQARTSGQRTWKGDGGMTRCELTTSPCSKTTLALVTAFVGTLILPPGSVAQEAEVRAVLEAHRRSLTVDGDSLHGPGGQWLMDCARSARFTLIGESHHNAETPRLTRALLTALQSSGYSAYVVEAGPESTRLLRDAVAREGISGGASLLERFPFSIAFLDQREELHTVAEALALGYEVWGIDQEFIGSPRLLLHRLRELVSDADYRARIENLINREMAALERLVETGDQSGALLLSASADEFDALASAFPDPQSEGARIIRQLRASAEIYRAFAEQRYYDNNARTYLINEGDGAN